ncbi:glycosyltransferase [Deinococcus maricopensis]|uniref:Glycosyl transferase family 2 n=1 Tax=Deinococcus maricopensis (strain DSM 21211 / LMG 22137 / NRRL B-23946 / LB-34) TaxID=709986 RepID=E8U4M6_DEIML|nr:glycosyltransferase family 2 protein [Deinococcus maricopensis]ADV68891.1 glycosyl transferase family 2 [Deinococcus maricopensis DSM 21211]
MTAARWFRTLTRGFVLTKLAVLAVNALVFPRLRRGRPGSGARVSLLVPARNEVHNLPRTLPGLLAQGAHEVLVLDDGSTDGTADVARTLGARVLPGAALPDGWCGKPWACQQLAQAATGDVLVFTDADVTWAPGALHAVLHELECSGAHLLSVYPRQDARTLGERLLVPLVDDVLLGLLPAPLLRWPVASMGAANGQVMVFRAGAYRRLGGHALVRAEVLEDVRFGTRVKARGGRLALALGGGLIHVRMYGGYREATRGFAKGLVAAHGGSRALAAASWAWHVAVYTLPWVTGRPALGALTLLERVAANAVAGRTRPADLAEALLMPVTPLAALPVYLRALLGRTAWKGRTYPRRRAP